MSPVADLPVSGGRGHPAERLLGAQALSATAMSMPWPALLAQVWERQSRSTDLLVTAEVTAFVVGPAIGGLLLGFGAGSWSVLAAAGLSVVAVLLLVGLPGGPVVVAPVSTGPSRWRTVLRSPGVAAAIAVVATVNLAESAASVGLLGLDHGRWGAGEAGFGAATAALGFGSLAAPLIGLAVRLRGSVLLTAGGLAGSGCLPGVAAAAAPLALVGAAGTVVECASTETLQRSVPDHVRAFSLGLTDMAMVAAAMVGALLAPQVVSAAGPVVLFVGLGVLVAGTGAVLGRRARVDGGRQQPGDDHGTARSARVGGSGGADTALDP